MRARFVMAAALTVSLGAMTVAAGRAEAADTGGEYTSAGAQASGGQLSVQAGVTTWTPPSGSHWAQAAKPDPPPGKPNPNQPYGCSYGAGGPSATASLGVGGPQPGQWGFPVFAGPGGIDPMPPFWVTGAKPVTVAVQVAPVVVAEQAAKTLALSSPVIEMAPPEPHPQLVNVATWLWLNPAAWHPVRASARAGPVTTTAVATPTKVVWDMGDGQQVTCAGPGTPYDPSAPDATTTCSYRWSAVGTYTVSATIYWAVTWNATGAAGGGSLGAEAGPAAAVNVQVVQSEAINTPSSGGH